MGKYDHLIGGFTVTIDVEEILKEEAAKEFIENEPASENIEEKEVLHNK